MSFFLSFFLSSFFLSSFFFLLSFFLSSFFLSSFFLSFFLSSLSPSLFSDIFISSFLIGLLFCSQLYFFISFLLIFLCIACTFSLFTNLQDAPTFFQNVTCFQIRVFVTRISPLSHYSRVGRFLLAICAACNVSDFNQTGTWAFAIIRNVWFWLWFLVWLATLCTLAAENNGARGTFTRAHVLRVSHASGVWSLFCFTFQSWRLLAI